MPSAVQNLFGNLQNRMGQPQPTGGQPNPAPGQPLPANMQAGNTPSNLMEHLSGLLGGGDPMQEQNNAFVQGKVNEYMASQQALKAKAQQAGAKAAARTLKAGQSTTPAPQLASPGTGVTPSNPLQQLWQSVQSQLGMNK